MFLIHLPFMQNFKKIKNQLLRHNQINFKFYSLKLCIKNKFIDQIVNDI